MSDNKAHCLSSWDELYDELHEYYDIVAGMQAENTRLRALLIRVVDGCEDIHFDHDSSLDENNVALDRDLFDEIKNELERE